MSNSLLNKINQDVQTEIDAIEAESKELVAVYEAETKRLLEAAAAVHKEALEKEKQHLETVAISKARQAGNIAAQAARRAGIDAVFDAVFADLKDADAAAYVTFFAKVAKEVVPKKVSGTAYAPSNRLDETKKILKEVGVDATVSEKSGIAAGFVLDTDEGVYDATLERIFLELRPSLEVELLNHVK